MNNENREIDITPSQALTPTVVTPMSLIQQAQSQGAGIDQMQQLLDLQIRWEENEAKKAYFKAVALFKAEAIDIIKKKKVKYKTDKGTTEYNHAELGQIVNTVTPFLSKHGLSHHWEYLQADNKVKVTCFLTHEMGYEKSTSLEAPPDSSGGKNGIQAIGSTTSYLERYTFLAMTGLASREQDDDGKMYGEGEQQPTGNGKPNVVQPQAHTETKAPTGEMITEGQQKMIFAKLKAAGLEVKDLTEHLKITGLDCILRDNLTATVKMIESGSVPKC